MITGSSIDLNVGVTALDNDDVALVGQTCSPDWPRAPAADLMPVCTPGSGLVGNNAAYVTVLSGQDGAILWSRLRRRWERRKQRCHRWPGRWRDRRWGHHRTLGQRAAPGGGEGLT
jgi:hypothetical protein